RPRLCLNSPSKKPRPRSVPAFPSMTKKTMSSPFGLEFFPCARLRTLPLPILACCPGWKSPKTCAATNSNAGRGVRVSTHCDHKPPLPTPPLLRWPRDPAQPCAVVLFVAELFVHFRRALDWHPVTHDETRIDLPFLYPLQKRPHVAHHVRLTRFHGQAFVHERPHRYLVIKSGIDSWNRNRSALPACLNALPQNDRSICFHPHRLLGLVQEVHQAVVMRFHADRIDAGVRADVACHLFQCLDYIINFFVVDG